MLAPSSRSHRCSKLHDRYPPKYVERYCASNRWIGQAEPKQRVPIHSDQGSQFTSMDWSAFIRAHNLEHAMSPRGNCHNNVVAESFFSSGVGRIELTGFTEAMRERLRAFGLFTDIIAWKLRFFVPVARNLSGLAHL
jgi:transposase InsO family protein